MDYNITYRQKDKGWQFIISYKINGTWKQKAKQGFKLKSDAKSAADKRVLELKKELKTDNILNTDYKTITFKQLSDAFITHNKLYKEPNTIEKYKNATAKFINLSSMRVKDIKKMHIQAGIDCLVSEAKASSTIITYLTQIKLMLNYYKDNYDSNYIVPVEKLSIPKKKIKEKLALTKDELFKLLDKLKKIDDDIYLVSLVAGTCGLRIGEIEGLTWSDIKIKTMELDVNKQWKKLKDGTIGFGNLKNNRRRMVPLPTDTLKKLLKYKESHPTDLTNRIIILNKYTLANKLDSTLKKAGGVTIHELRHTYATILIASNTMDFKTIAQILGHNVEQTLRTYSHVTNEMYKNAKKEIANIF
ncbi:MULTISPECIES: tyrosine-type recombinase/integrase [unclassified Clostridium]|uniref:tyrosine-type recombinase/integrase n=1 Tax=unclassified Clostridium TaxID=2614128 RepID=UPI002079667E|nr:MULTISPECIES: tyrosine-type recombinase/integrase [unclassified Clostridium]